VFCGLFFCRPAQGRVLKEISLNKVSILIFINRNFSKVDCLTIDSPRLFAKMIYSNGCRYSTGDIMKPVKQEAAVFASRSHFNYNKLQAAACIVSSAAVSIGLTYLAIRWLS
jgi:hypothetical protein